MFVSLSALSKTPIPELNTQSLALQRSYLQAIDCRAPEQLSNALKQAIKNADDWTKKGTNASVFEEIMMQNPACFIQGLNKLPKKSCQQFQVDYINETFFYPRDDIKKALARAKNYGQSCIAS